MIDKVNTLLRVVTVLVLIWIGLEVRWTRGAIPYGLDYHTEQTLNHIKNTLDDLLNERKGR